MSDHDDKKISVNGHDISYSPSITDDEEQVRVAAISLIRYVNYATRLKALMKSVRDAEHARDCEVGHMREYMSGMIDRNGGHEVRISVMHRTVVLSSSAGQCVIYSKKDES